MINIAVCDDDIAYLNNYLYKAVLLSVNKINMKAKIKLFSSGEKLLKEYKSNGHFDIVILDIDMPNLNGKELASRLRLIDNAFFLIFITSYENELENTIRYRINAFISKSSDKDTMKNELIRVFNEYLHYKPQYETFEIIKDGLPSIYRFALNNVMGIYFKESIVHLLTASHDYTLREKVFSKSAKKLLNNGFFQCHRNYIVNIAMIDEIRENILILENGEVFPVSKRKYKELVKAFTAYAIEEVEG